MIQTNQLDFPGFNNNSTEVVIKELQSLEETLLAMQSLRERKAVILNLASLNSEQAQRVVDWMAGTTYAIDGKTIWIEKKTFLFVPNCIEVSTSRSDKPLVSPRVVS